MKLSNFSKQLLLASGLLFAALGAKATCAAHFTWSQTSANTIGFTNNSTGATASTRYTWDFGDGTIGYGSTISHVFSIPAGYVVCVTMADSSNSGTSCTSTFCDSVIVSGVLICNVNMGLQSVSASCLTCQDGSASISYLHGATGALTYAWSGGGVTGSASTLTGLFPGTYSLTVTDAYGCQATAAANVMSNDSNCHAHFTKLQTAPNTVQFTSNSHNVSLNTSYYWDFGNGTYGYGSAASCVFNTPGIYTVCLNINDSSNIPAGCSSMYCDTVKVTGGVICNLTATVNTFMPTCTTCTDGGASITPGGGTAPYVYSWSCSATTSATVTGLMIGTYTACAFDANGCHACNSFTLAVPHCGAAFTLTADTSSPGDYIASNNSYGTGAIQSTWNWGDGGYDSAMTPVHVYNAPGLYTICLTIYDATGCSSTYCDTLSAARLPSWLAAHHTKVNVVNHTSATGIAEEKLIEKWAVYPNPANTLSSIIYSLNQDAAVDIVLYDLTGREVFTREEPVIQNAGTHQIMINMSGLQPGMYLVRITAGKQTETKRIAVIR